MDMPVPLQLVLGLLPSVGLICGYFLGRSDGRVSGYKQCISDLRKLASLPDDERTMRSPEDVARRAGAV